MPSPGSALTLPLELGDHLFAHAQQGERYHEAIGPREPEFLDDYIVRGSRARRAMPSQLLRFVIASFVKLRQGRSPGPVPSGPIDQRADHSKLGLHRHLKQSRLDR